MTGSSADMDATQVDFGTLGPARSATVAVEGFFRANQGQTKYGGVEASGNVTETYSTIEGRVRSGASFSGTGGTIRGDVEVSGTITGSATIQGVRRTGVAYVPSIDHAAVRAALQGASAGYDAMTPTASPVQDGQGGSCSRGSPGRARTPRIGLG